MLFQQQNHFVHVDSQVGFTQSDIDKAKKYLIYESIRHKR